MTSSTPAEPSHVAHDDMEAALKQHGIVRVPADTFHYGGYRYTNIKDAIAEAKRHPGRAA
ncbi:hypothetical protein [Sphingomonas lenta]|uniref:Uncharacterized protein n=1 Tax=Sphingomonas lenta TaxID=1141887 RepID=A0A2A2SHT7_9SPHN|nr:hypothetical protein [Sphingomonas lenta]PAX08837.1 hypothetical protein CKY28_05640 [Sphingomonas lenta]